MAGRLAPLNRRENRQCDRGGIKVAIDHTVKGSRLPNLNITPFPHGRLSWFLPAPRAQGFDPETARQSGRHRPLSPRDGPEVGVKAVLVQNPIQFGWGFGDFNGDLNIDVWIHRLWHRPFAFVSRSEADEIDAT